jgi:outer membrane lipoprotein SlyB
VLVEKGGKLRDAARLGVRFHTLVLDDGLQVPVVTETIYREGRSRGSDSIAKIGGTAVGGAILGAIFGGGRGAAIGGSIGAAGGTAAALNNGEAEPAGLPPGTRLTVRLSRPVAVAVER